MAERTWKSSAFINSTVSTPSRAIMKTVKANTPRQAAGPTRRAEASSRSSMSPLIVAAARHMWMVSVVTMIAAAIASTPSQSDWFAARANRKEAPTLTSRAAAIPQYTATTSRPAPRRRR